MFEILISSLSTYFEYSIVGSLFVKLFPSLKFTVVCSKTFSRKSHLRKHIRNVHRSTCERDNITVTIDNVNYSTKNDPYVNTEELPSTSFSENFVCPDIFEDVGDDFENFINSEEFNSPNLEIHKITQNLLTPSK